MNPTKALQEHGQSLWLDYIQRGLIESGGLQQLIEEDGITGLTSNPTIFEKAIAGSTDYDDAIRKRLDANPETALRSLYEGLVVEDIQMTADLLRPIYDQTHGMDGFVSLEVNPHLAHDTTGTIVEARRLWRSVDRPNLMIKVPATPEGVPAIENLVAEGINVNVTLIFSLTHYEAIAHAYIRGVARHPDPRRVASVASFFVSRVDTAVDKRLEAIGMPEALALRGKIAVASAKRGYRRFCEIFHGDEFDTQRQRGARVQRCLWGSTSTKNPAYSDLLYVENLIGPETVNTVPPVTLEAFRDHGRPRATIREDLDEAEALLEQLSAIGIDLNAITEQLQAEGLAAFTESYDKLMAALEKKRRAILASHVHH